MKSTTTLGLILGGMLLLAGCSEKTTTNETAATAPLATNTAEPMGNMADMDMSAPAAKTAKGSGTVAAIDAAAGKITLDHGPIAEAGWPAMKMAFDAKPEVLSGVAVGDKVVFDLALKDGSGEVTAIQKQ
jgi:Cu/Ag efflux protein CusF